MIELIVVIAIVAIMLNVAAPNFSAMMSRNRATTQVNEFIIAVNLARNEALRVGNIVSVQAVDPSDSDDEYGNGWCVVVGNPGDCNGTVIRNFAALTNDATLDSFEDSGSIQFNSFGEVESGLAQNIDLCVSIAGNRRIFIALIGRTKAHKPTDSNVAKQPDCD